MPEIAADAHVDAGARLGTGVRVGPGVIIAADVEVGPDTDLRPGTVLEPGTRIGARCRVGPYAIIGGTPMDHRFGGEASYVVVGDDVEVREFSTIHRATGEGASTRIADGALVMCYVHVAHNVRVGRDCVLTNNVQLGGHAEVGDCAVLGGGVMVHQFARVGAYAMIGGDSTVSNDVLPYALAQGNPARHFRSNRVGLERRGFDAEARSRLESALRFLRRKDREAFLALAEAHEDVAVLKAFIETSDRGVAKFVGG